jgi:dimethylaniline monooxygenase (N-oxide forming)
VKACVIGSGVFGIAAGREIARAVPDCELHWISVDPEAGGLWSASSNRSRVYDSLYLNTSRQRSAFTGTVIEADPSVHFVHHSCYAAYLREVAAGCAAAERHWECLVTSVTSQPDGSWRLHWQTREGRPCEEGFDAVVDATGHSTEPLGPKVPAADHLAYEYRHSASYKNVEPYCGKRVLVIGSGASAVDIVCDLVPVASHVAISIGSPKWFLPKTFLGQPIDHSSDSWWQHAPVLGRLAAGVAESVVHRVVGRYRSYGLEDPATRLSDSIPVLSDHFLGYLSHGRVQVHGRVAALEQTSVVFADGTADKFDVVVAATGFRDSSPHLPGRVQSSLARGNLGLGLEVPGFAGLFLMNRFRCGDAAVRCAEVQASAIARALLNTPAGRSVPPSIPGLAATSPRITARSLRKTYEAYR